MADLSQFDTVKHGEAGVDMPLRFNGVVLKDDKTGQPMTIRLMGKDAGEFRRRSHEIANKRIEMSATKGVQLNFNSEELELEHIELMVLLTKGWSGISLDGAELPFTEDNARKLYKRFPWLREEVDKFTGARANYLGNASKNS